MVPRDLAEYGTSIIPVELGMLKLLESKVASLMM